MKLALPLSSRRLRTLLKLPVDCLKAGVAPERLRRLAESPQKSTAHMVAIAKPRLARNDIDWMAGMLH